MTFCINKEDIYEKFDLTNVTYSKILTLLKMFGPWPAV